MRKIGLTGYSQLNRNAWEEWPSDVEVWGMNENHHFLTRWDRWFQIHPKDWNFDMVSGHEYFFIACDTCGWERLTAHKDKAHTLNPYAEAHIKETGHTVYHNNKPYNDQEYGRTEFHVDWMANCGVPVYQQFVDERIPTSIAYPMDLIIKHFGVDAMGTEDPTKFRQVAYLTSSVTWMLALALAEHMESKENPGVIILPRDGTGMRYKDGYVDNTVSDIYIAGIEMAIGTEYVHQRPCMEWYLGIARGLGIKVHLPTRYGSSILAGPIYAIDTAAPIFLGDEPVKAHHNPKGQFAYIQDEDVPEEIET